MWNNPLKIQKDLEIQLLHLDLIHSLPIISFYLIKNYQPIQKGDVIETAADTSALENWIGIRPKIDIKIGVKKFADWYKSFY